MDSRKIEKEFSTALRKEQSHFSTERIVTEGNYSVIGQALFHSRFEK